MQGLSALTKAFVSPAMQESITKTQQYAATRLLPPAPPPPPPEEPFQHLPPQGPFSTGASWIDSLHFLGPAAHLTAIFVGIGVIVGYGSTCLGRRRKRRGIGIAGIGPDGLNGEESEKDEYMVWADEHYDEPSSDGTIEQVYIQPHSGDEMPAEREPSSGASEAQSEAQLT